MKFNYDMRVDWRSNGKADHKDGIALGAVVAGASTSGLSTEKALSVPQMRKVFEAANQSRDVTILIRLDAKPFFPLKRAFDFMVIEIHDATSTGKLIVTAKCHDLTIVGDSKVKTGDGWFEAITLDLSKDEDFETTLP